MPTDAETRAAIRTLILAIGDNPECEELYDTPDRVIRAWREWGAGYLEDPTKHLAFFKEGVPDEMVIVKDIEVFSHCAHHLVPFYGAAAVGYLPSKARGVLGLSKIGRLVRHFASKLQTQERLTEEIADFFQSQVSPDIGVVIQCNHMCMGCRGVRMPGASTITSSLKGKFFASDARKEFLQLIRA